MPPTLLTRPRLFAFGLVSASVQMSLREFQFRPFGYHEDLSWHRIPTTIMVEGVPTLIINLGGVIFYTDAIELAAELAAITVLADLPVLLPRIISTARVGLGAIQGWVAAGRGVDGARAQGAFATASLLAGFGFVL